MITHSSRKGSISGESNHVSTISYGIVGPVDANIRVAKIRKKELSPGSYDVNSVVSIILADSSPMLDGRDIRICIFAFLHQDDFFALSRVNRACQTTINFVVKHWNLGSSIPTPSTSHIMQSVPLLKMAIDNGWGFKKSREKSAFNNTQLLFDFSLACPKPLAAFQNAAFVGNIAVMKYLIDIGCEMSHFRWGENMVV